jgi:hypothetical protein
MNNEIEELKDQIAELTIDNTRIKKTSAARFEQIKVFKVKSKDLDILTSRFCSIREFLVDNGFRIRCYEGAERPDVTVVNVVRGLMAKKEKKEAVSVDGIYTVKIDGKYKVARIIHSICWQISFDWEQKNPKYTGVHQLNIEEFALLDLI